MQPNAKLQLAAASSLQQEARHAATGENPDLQIAGSHQTNDGLRNGAHGGLCTNGKDWEASSGASALMPLALYEFAKPVHGKGSSGGESAAEAAVAQPGSALGRAPEVVRSNRTSFSTSTDEQVTKSAEHLGIAGRPATADDCVAGSALAQPERLAFSFVQNTERLVFAARSQATPPRGAGAHIGRPS